MNRIIALVIAKAALAPAWRWASSRTARDSSRRAGAGHRGGLAAVGLPL